MSLRGAAALASVRLPTRADRVVTVDQRSRCRATRGRHCRSVRADRGARAGAAHVSRGGARSEGPGAALADHQLPARSSGCQLRRPGVLLRFRGREKRAEFTLEATAAATPPEPPCVYARIVPERFDDMAWENDRIAHRMYGIALNSPVAAAAGERLRGSGIDVWGKRVTYPIVDRWYAKGHDQFHKDGKAKASICTASAVRAAPAARASGTAAKLWTSDNFVSAQLLSNGPRRAAFMLSYAPWDAGSAGQVQRPSNLRSTAGATSTSSRARSTSPTTSGGRHRHHRASAGRRFPQGRVDARRAGRWMSLWEENKDGGLGIAVILAAGTSAEPLRSRLPRRRGQRQSSVDLQGARRRARALLHRCGLERERSVRGPRELGRLRADRSRRRWRSR